MLLLSPTWPYVLQSHHHPKHTPIQGHNLEAAPISTVPQCYGFIREGQQVGFECRNHRSCDVPSRAVAVGPFLEQAQCGQACDRTAQGRVTGKDDRLWAGQQPFTLY